MSETEKARSPLAGVCTAGAVGGPASTPPLAVSERWPLAMIQVAAIPNLAFPRGEIETHLGLPLPPANAASGDGRRTALGAGPGRWMIVGERKTHVRLAEELDRLAGGAAAVTDLSHARAVIRLAGLPAQIVLAKGCALDLDAAAMRPGRTAVTALARLPVLLHMADDRPTYDVYVHRSYGESFWDWLRHSAAEFGYRIAALES